MYSPSLKDLFGAGEMWLVPPEMPNVPVPPSHAVGLPSFPVCHVQLVQGI